MTVSMPRLTVGIGSSLILLGLAAYLFSGRSSPTALIPAAFGIVLVLLGLLAGRMASPKHVMHAAAVLALLGFLGTAGALPELARLLLGGDVERPLATAAKAVMAIDLAVYLAYCIRSFREARKVGAQ